MPEVSLNDRPAILNELEAAPGPQATIVGMTYDDVIAGVCLTNRSLRPACDRMDAFNRILTRTYSAAGLPVADVAGAFENASLAKAASNVCAWTWYCTRRDFHPNTAGYRVIARTFERVLP